MVGSAAESSYVTFVYSICYTNDMKLLNGSELAGYIKERQAKSVRALRQEHHISPKLAIIVTIEHPAIDVYMRMKNRYGADIAVDVEVHRVNQIEVPELITRLNNEPTIHGIIIQLPLADPSDTDRLVNLVAPEKDVDALGTNALFDPATPMAILWLLAGYNIDLTGKQIVLIGRGKLVGAPLERMLLAAHQNVQVVDRSTPHIADITLEADIIITATGQPGIIGPSMIKSKAVVVDAGVAGEEGKTVGDVAAAVYDRDDLTITPPKGGVGPLTICALFDNVIRAAQLRIPS
jgi:methylenetetrahydrofolate dehydrogenase (NADP+)/methenyltetrahydrofolate cyclohydrolase